MILMPVKIDDVITTRNCCNLSVFANCELFVANFCDGRQYACFSSTDNHPEQQLLLLLLPGCGGVKAIVHLLFASFVLIMLLVSHDATPCRTRRGY